MYKYEVYGDDGKLYMHQENYKSFLTELNNSYLHDYSHRRYLIQISEPRPVLKSSEIVKSGEDRSFSTVLGVYPLHQPEGLFFYAEDNHADPVLGEKLIIYESDSNYLLSVSKRKIIYFRGNYWNCNLMAGGHYGPHDPPAKIKQNPLKQWGFLGD